MIPLPLKQEISISIQNGLLLTLNRDFYVFPHLLLLDSFAKGNILLASTLSSPSKYTVHRNEDSSHFKFQTIRALQIIQRINLANFFPPLNQIYPSENSRCYLTKAICNQHRQLIILPRFYSNER